MKKLYYECPDCQHESAAKYWIESAWEYCDPCECEHLTRKCPVCAEWKFDFMLGEVYR